MMIKTLNSDQSKKAVVQEFFNLIGAGQYREVLPLFTADCKTHNPYIAGDMNTLIDAMISASNDMKSQASDISFSVKHILIDGEMAAAYTQLLNSKTNPGKGGLRQVHLFRFEGDMIAEYWDITQQILDSMPNAAEAF